MSDLKVRPPEEGVQEEESEPEAGAPFAKEAQGKQSEDVLWRIAGYANGDARTAYNTLELCVRSAEPDARGVKRITKTLLEDVLQRKMLRYDKGGIRIRMRRCIGWRGCWRVAKIHFIWRGAWCGWPARILDWRSPVHWR